jgi:hypothetical protein
MPWTRRIMEDVVIAEAARAGHLHILDFVCEEYVRTIPSARGQLSSLRVPSESPGDVCYPLGEYICKCANGQKSTERWALQRSLLTTADLVMHRASRVQHEEGGATSAKAKREAAAATESVADHAPPEMRHDSTKSPGCQPSSTCSRWRSRGHVAPAVRCSGDSAPRSATPPHLPPARADRSCARCDAARTQKLRESSPSQSARAHHAVSPLAHAVHIAMRARHSGPKRAPDDDGATALPSPRGRLDEDV